MFLDMEKKPRSRSYTSDSENWVEVPCRMDRNVFWNVKLAFGAAKMEEKCALADHQNVRYMEDHAGMRSTKY
jgi:hypothetical protein